GRHETPSGRPAGAYPDPWQVPSYGQPPYGQPQYGQSPYGYEQYGQPPFGQVQPARPGTVITAAVLGLVFGALGVLVTVGGLVGLLADPGTDGQLGGVLFLSLFFLAALAMLVLLCLRSAGQFFTAHRQRRALPR